MGIHPALTLFAELFAKEAEGSADDVRLPTYYVSRSTFRQRLRDAGIEAPENICDFMAWEEKIGLTEFVHKIISAHHKKAGTDFTPMEKGTWRLRQRMKKSSKAPRKTHSHEA